MVFPKALSLPSPTIHLTSKLYIPKGEWNSGDAGSSTDTESAPSFCTHAGTRRLYVRMKVRGVRLSNHQHTLHGVNLPQALSNIKKGNRLSVGSTFVVEERVSSTTASQYQPGTLLAPRNPRHTAAKLTSLSPYSLVCNRRMELRRSNCDVRKYKLHV